MAATMKAPLLENRFLERLEQLTLHWQRSFPGLVGGHNRSRFAGSGQEFLDHRHFHEGDDLRGVNWRAFLRLEKLFLKMFQVEPRVPVRILVDVSGSMETGTPSKFEYAMRLVGALCYVGLVRLDKLSVLPFRERLLEPLQVGGGRHRFGPVADFLLAQEPEGRSSFVQVARDLLTRHPQRGLVIMVSDFLDEDSLQALQYLNQFGHELNLVQVWGDEDRTPPWTGDLQLVDAESGSDLALSLDEAARQRYTEAFDAHAEALRQTALRHEGRYVGLATSLSLEDAVFYTLMRARGVA